MEWMEENVEKSKENCVCLERQKRENGIPISVGIVCEAIEKKIREIESGSSSQSDFECQMLQKQDKNLLDAMVCSFALGLGDSLDLSEVSPVFLLHLLKRFLLADPLFSFLLSQEVCNTKISLENVHSVCTFVVNHLPNFHLQIFRLVAKTIKQSSLGNSQLLNGFCRFFVECFFRTQKEESENFLIVFSCLVENVQAFPPTQEREEEEKRVSFSEKMRASSKKSGKKFARISSYPPSEKNAGKILIKKKNSVVLVRTRKSEPTIQVSSFIPLVFPFLGKKELLQCREVCKQWNRMLCKQVFWRQHFPIVDFPLLLHWFHSKEEKQLAEALKWDLSMHRIFCDRKSECTNFTGERVNRTSRKEDFLFQEHKFRLAFVGEESSDLSSIFISAGLFFKVNGVKKHPMGVLLQCYQIVQGQQEEDPQLFTLEIVQIFSQTLKTNEEDILSCNFPHKFSLTKSMEQYLEQEFDLLLFVSDLNTQPSTSDPLPLFFSFSSNKKLDNPERRLHSVLQAHVCPSSVNQSSQMFASQNSFFVSNYSQLQMLFSSISKRLLDIKLKMKGK